MAPQPAGAVSPLVGSILAETDAFLARLRLLLNLDREGNGGAPQPGTPAAQTPPADLSYSGIPESLATASRLVRRVVTGDLGARAELARWMADLDRLTAGLEALRASGALDPEVLVAYRRLLGENESLFARWAATRGRAHGSP
jgi:hypothetical protein